MTDTRERWSFEQIKSCSWMAQGAPYVAQIAAPTIDADGGGDAGALSTEIKIPPRSQPRMRAAGSSFGSFSGSFLGFPSFSEASAGGGLLSSGGGAHVSSMA